MRTFHAGCVPKLLVVSAFAAACVVTLKARWALADLGDGKPMTPSGLTVSIESCAKAAPGNGMDPAVQLAYCACVTDYMDGLRPKAALSNLWSLTFEEQETTDCTDSTDVQKVNGLA